MALAAPISLKEWFDGSVEDFLVIAPTSTSPQPVHVLNGFFHTALTRPRGAPRVAIDAVATRMGRWARSPDDLRAKAPGVFPEDDHELAKIRRALSGLIATDRAVFAGPASFQLAHLGLVTSDSTHFRLGALAARLALGPGDAGAALSGLVTRLQHAQPSAHWAVEAVLADPGTVDEIRPGELPDANWWGQNETCRALATELGATLRRSLELAGGDADALLGLRTLAVSATWVGLIAYAQVPSLLVDGRLSPLLAEAGPPGSLSTLRSASASALNLVNSTFERWLIERLYDEVEVRFGADEPTDEEAAEFVASCEPYTLSGGSKRTHERLAEIVRVWMADGGGSKRAIAHTLQDDLIASMGDKPRKWFSAVGRHCGFVGPRRGHPARFRIEVGLIPTLLLAGVSDDDGETVAMSTWLERLADRYGVFFGPHPVCREMVPRASEEELERNVRDLASLLASLGVARRYSDGVTEILNPLTLWRLQ